MRYLSRHGLLGGRTPLRSGGRRTGFRRRAFGARKIVKIGWARRESRAFCCWRKSFVFLCVSGDRDLCVVSREEILGAIKSSHGAGLCTAGAGAGKIRWQRNWQSVPQPYSCTMKAFPTSGSLAGVPRKRVRDRVETTARKNRRYDRRLPAKQLRPTIQKRYRHKPIP